MVTIFVFYFQKLVFENIKKKQFSCIFEIKNVRTSFGLDPKTRLGSSLTSPNNEFVEHGRKN